MATQEIRELERAVPFSSNGTGDGNVGLDYRILNWIGIAGNQAPAYWSRQRDIWLRQFYLKSDYLKIAVRTFVSKAYAVPLTIASRDRSVKAHNALAEQIQTDILRNSGMLKGFMGEFAKFATDYVTQDNGAFMLVMGPGKADGPITGQVVGLMHLDSQRCNRTGNIEFPVIYEHTDGRRYKLHYTRVILMSALPSADAELYDVGLCAVSACIDAAQDMLDVMGYTSEKLGSRPARQILYVKQGASLEQLNSAVLLANTKMNAEGLERFSRTMLMAPAKGSVSPLDLATIELSGAPDGFDREKATVMDVAVIAAAFGMDARDLAHSFGLSGQTKADAEVQNLKTYGKGVNQFLEEFAKQLDEKVVPATLECWFDYIDDTQDQQAAAIRKIRAEGRGLDLNTGVITERVAREQMLENGELTDEQFEMLELADGRLPDGMNVLMLFQSQDPEIAAILQPVTDNPFGQAGDDLINQQMQLAWSRHDGAPNANIKRKMRQSIAALEKLRGNAAAPVENQPLTPAVKGLTTKEDDQLDPLMVEYQAKYGRLVKRAADGEIQRDDFEREAEELVAALLLLAFLRGSQLTEAQLTVQMREMIDEKIAANVEAINGFAEDIYAGRYSAERLGEEGISNRVELWTGALIGAYALGQVNRSSDPYWMWVLGDANHCSDCIRLNGQVHTASEWRAAGLQPQANTLKCTWHCKCRFVEVTGPSQGGF